MVYIPYRRSGLNRKLLQMAVAVLSLLVFSSSAFAVRGRPHIDSSLGHNILLSDQNTLLRGVSLSWDGGDPYGNQTKVMPTQAKLNALANEYGLNTVHLYLEGDSTESRSANSVGYNAADCDTLVQRCADAGLYLIITIGCNGENGTMDLSWSQDFWDFYAPRYKDETHVLYEAHNEPVPNTLYSWTTSDWDDQAALYTTIRTNAPDSFILLCSFMGFVGDNNINSTADPRNRANYLAANGVSWSNAGMAHHGYESKVGIESAISLMATSTNYPALLCTEFGPEETEFQGYNSMYESHFNGWMQFQWLGADNFDLYGSDYGFKTRIRKAGTIWTPDVATCTWPVTGSPNIPAHGSSVGIYARGTAGFIRINGNNDLIADLETYTGSQDDLFIIEDAGDNRISLKAANGLYVSTSSQNDSLTANSASAGVNEMFYWYELANGDVALRAFGGGGHLIRSAGSGLLLPNADHGWDPASNYAFVDGSAPSGPPTDPAPFNGTPMAVPGTIEVEDFNYGGEGAGYHDANADNQGGRYRTSEWVDIENCNEGGFNVAYTADGEWLKYTVNVASPGEYTLTMRAARGISGAGAFHIEVDGVNVTGSISVPRTSGWQGWTDITKSNVMLSGGEQVMKLVIERGDINLHRMTFVLDQVLNNPPFFTSYPVVSKANATEDVAYSDTIAGDAIDPEGDPLSFSLIAGGPAWLSMATNGALSGIPENDDVGLNSWTVEVSDGTNSPASATLEIMVDNVNDAPAFTTDPVIGTDALESSFYIKTIAGSASDMDAGDTLTYSKVEGPPWLNIQTNGTIVGMPSPADVGLNSWALEVTDGIAAPVSATLKIAVYSAIPPVVNVEVSGSDMELVWPSSYTTYNLYSCTNLLPPVVWTSVTNPPVIQGDDLKVTLPTDGSPKYFRLMAP